MFEERIIIKGKVLKDESMLHIGLFTPSEVMENGKVPGTIFTLPQLLSRKLQEYNGKLYGNAEWIDATMIINETLVTQGKIYKAWEPRQPMKPNRKFRRSRCA